MPRKTRLTRRDPVKRTHRFPGELFFAMVGPAERGSKVAAVISKKVAAKASDRNLIKRRARAVLSKEAFPSSVVLILQARKEAATATFTEIERDIKAVMKKVRAAHGA